MSLTACACACMCVWYMRTSSSGFSTYKVVTCELRSFSFPLFSVGVIYHFLLPKDSARNSPHCGGGSVESERPSLVPDLSGKAFGLSPPSVTSAAVCSHVQYVFKAVCTLLNLYTSDNSYLRTCIWERGLPNLISRMALDAPAENQNRNVLN